MKSVPRYTCFMTELSRRSSRWDRPNVLPNSYQSNQPVLEYFLTYFIRFISDQNQTFIHTWPSLSHRTLPKKKKQWIEPCRMCATWRPHTHQHLRHSFFDFSPLWSSHEPLFKPSHFFCQEISQRLLFDLSTHLHILWDLSLQPPPTKNKKNPSSTTSTVNHQRSEITA